MKRGDLVTQVEILRRADQKAADDELKNLLLPIDPFDPIKLDDNRHSWTYIHSLLQEVRPENQVKLTFTRGGKSQTAAMPTETSTTFFDESRSISRPMKRVVRKAESLGDAFQLGFRETTEQLKQVVLILRSLVTGELSPTNLSGPAGIIAVAGSFASEGLPMLLLFLTMLSANLAILNFLPIPALDGGHMLFLTAEAVRGKPVDERLQVRLTVLGVICLLSLMVFATAMDIGRFAQVIQQWFG